MSLGMPLVLDTLRMRCGRMALVLSWAVVVVAGSPAVVVVAGSPAVVVSLIWTTSWLEVRISAAAAAQAY
jgi:hypothetical protein